MTAKTAAAAARATVYGYPRQGPNRELKKASEGYWKGRVTADALRRTAADLRRSTWQQLADTGIHEVPTGDFSYYDHALDTSVMVGAVPQRHRAAVGADALDGYFAMARSPWPPWARSSASPIRWMWPPPAPSCTYRSTLRLSRTSIRRSFAGSPSPGRRQTRSSPWPRAWLRAPTPSSRSSPPIAPTSPPARTPRSPTTRLSGPGPPPSQMPTAAAPSRTRSGSRPERPPRTATAAHHDHRIVPADERTAHRPCRSARRAHRHRRL